MPKYIIYADITHNYSIEIEANDRTDAKELAANTSVEQWDNNDSGYVDIFDVVEYNS